VSSESVFSGGWGEHHPETEAAVAVDRVVPDTDGGADVVVVEVEGAAAQHTGIVIARAQILAAIVEPIGILEIWIPPIFGPINCGSIPTRCR